MALDPRRIIFDDFKLRPGTGAKKIVGLKAVLRSFDKMSRNSDSDLTKEIHFAAFTIARRANKDVPVLSGDLLGSIKVTKGIGQARVDVGEKYASYVEKGTKNMKAQPYIFKHIAPAIKVLIRNMLKRATL